MSDCTQQDWDPGSPTRGPRANEVKGPVQVVHGGENKETDLKAGSQKEEAQYKQGQEQETKMNNPEPLRQNLGTGSNAGPENKEATTETKSLKKNDEVTIAEQQSDQDSPQRHGSSTNQSPQQDIPKSDGSTTKHKEKTHEEQTAGEKKQGLDTCQGQDPDKVTTDTQEKFKNTHQGLDEQNAVAKEQKEETSQKKENGKEQNAETSWENMEVSQDGRKHSETSQQHAESFANSETSPDLRKNKETSQDQTNTLDFHEQVKNKKTPSESEKDSGIAQEQDKHKENSQNQAKNTLTSQGQRKPSETSQEQLIHAEISEEQEKQADKDQNSLELDDAPLAPPKFKQTEMAQEQQKAIEMLRHPQIPVEKEPETPEGWFELCDKEWGLKERAVVIPETANWEEIYKKRPFGRNFLRSPNPEGLSTSQPPPPEDVDPPPQKKPLETLGDFTGWQISTEDIPVDRSRVPPGVVVCYLPIYSWCVKEQMVDLLSEGLWPELLDSYQPDIYVLDWYEDSKLHKHVYELHVKLLAEDKKTVLAQLDLAPENDMSGNPKGWNLVSHIFKSYGPGVRHVHFVHKSKDLSVLGFHRTRVADSTLFAQLRG